MLGVGTEQKRIVWPAKVGRRAKGPCDPGLSIGLTMTCYFACSACSLCSLSNDGPQGANVTWLLLNQFTTYEVIQFDPAAEKEPQTRIGKINLSRTI